MLVALLALLGLFAAAPVASAQEQHLTDYLECKPYQTPDGRQEICSGQVPSFDGVKLDVDLTKPLNDRGDKRHRLIVMPHGFGNDKHEWQSLRDEGEEHDKWHWNSHWFAKHGYYVLTYTARGFQSRQREREDQPNTPFTNSVEAPSPLSGTIHLKSRDFEIKDTQWLSALVAAAHPDLEEDEVAISGGSYGGGESWTQASQAEWSFPARCSAEATDRPPECRLPTTPDFGRLEPLQLQVAVPKYPWTDQAYSLAPNGHGGGESGTDLYESSQGKPESDTGDGNPIGVEKLSFVNGLFLNGNARGVFKTGTDRTPNEEDQTPFQPPPPSIPEWWERFTVRGDPYEAGPAEDTVARQVRQGLTEFRSSYYQEERWQSQRSGRKVAVYSIQGWTDDLFPAVESFRQFKYLKRLDPRWPVEVEVADIGHQRGQNKAATWRRLNDQAFQFLQAHIEGSHEQETVVSSQPTICPGEPEFPAAQRLTARSPEDLANGALNVDYGKPGKTNNPGGFVNDPEKYRSDPVISGNECTESDGEPPSTGPPDYVAYSKPLDETQTYAGLGWVTLPPDGPRGPANTATINVQVWDKDPSGEERLVTRGTYRYNAPAETPNETPAIRVPLFGNHWVFEPGHQIRLKVTQVDFPFLRPSNEVSSVSFGPPKLTLPTRQAGVRELPGG
jgi:X-Pro dipeptidyl-peptidase C-terminal non-catalytic domain